ncbi:GtrA family protein [Intrasporangium calvum]|uniref:GtrA family protein n=1 Tax=Intrasporangium calvum (strain ATCC 23552 / DSM 43043 / JCM 3097 / NBRC 12989 / NCIMB 10167 / NRRL B-3866 / 7 KIP) TaxID=710696 RepID=E6S8S4_INTC7|nr:GtrA family protein [Intrasporangium calvum]ADU47043.1 GtrA family protein [Intrasporangium calvum DSM 43043]
MNRWLSSSKLSSTLRWTHQPARYLVVAGTTSLVYLGLVAGGLALGLHYIAAILVAQVITISFAFPAYRHWVFAPGAEWTKDLARFVSVWSSGAVAGLVMTPLLVELAGWPPMLAQVVALVVVSVGSYLSHRFFTFRHVSP